MTENQNIDDLLAKYLADETDTHEGEIVGEWISTSENNRKTFEHSQLIFEGIFSLKNQREVDVDAAWKKLNISKKNISERVDNQEIKPILKNNWLNNFLKIAAVLVLLFGLWFVAAKQFVVPKNDVLSFKTGNTASEKTLPDGTKILLSKNSSITYPTTFEGNTREINLQGEAFFDVHHDAAHPFIIHTQGTDVRVLGTSFRVRAYDAQVQVVVKTGKVRFSKNDAEVILEKGQKAEILANSGTIIKSEVELEKTEMLKKKLSFDFEKTSLGEVIVQLNNTFDKKISFSNDKIKNCKLTASFQDEELENIIHIIAETFNLKIENQKDSIILSGEGCE
jgi:transmembrane sensor